MGKREELIDELRYHICSDRDPNCGCHACNWYPDVYKQTLWCFNPIVCDEYEKLSDLETRRALVKVYVARVVNTINHVLLWAESIIKPLEWEEGVSKGDEIDIALRLIRAQRRAERFLNVSTWFGFKHKVFRSPVLWNYFVRLVEIKNMRKVTIPPLHLGKTLFQCGDGGDECACKC